MRTVPNLKHIDQCPNCTGRGLVRTVDESGRPFLQCPICTETIYEIITIFDQEREKQEKKEQFVFELREEIYRLKWYAHTVDDAALIEQISLVLNRIIDYIENN